MPLEVGIWRLDKNMERITPSSIELESELEEAITKDISILSPTVKLMLIGRQIPTAYGKFIDLQRGLLDLVAPELRRAFRNRSYSDVLAWMALLKRSVSTAFACENTLTERTHL